MAIAMAIAMDMAICLLLCLLLLSLLLFLLNGGLAGTPDEGSGGDDNSDEESTPTPPIHTTFCSKHPSIHIVYFNTPFGSTSQEETTSTISMKLRRTSRRSFPSLSPAQRHQPLWLSAEVEPSASSSLRPGYVKVSKSLPQPPSFSMYRTVP